MGWHYVYSSLLQQYLQLKNTVSSYFLRLVVNAVDLGILPHSFLIMKCGVLYVRPAPLSDIKRHMKSLWLSGLHVTVSCDPRRICSENAESAHVEKLTSVWTAIWDGKCLRWLS